MKRIDYYESLHKENLKAFNELVKRVARFLHITSIQIDEPQFGNIRVVVPLLLKGVVMQKKRYWKWVCEFCFKQSNHNMLPAGWDLVWQSAVCPDCQKRVANDGGYFVVKGGAYAGARRDPRSGTTTRAVDLLDSSAKSALAAQPANH